MVELLMDMQRVHYKDMKPNMVFIAEIGTFDNFTKCIFRSCELDSNHSRSIRITYSLLVHPEHTDVMYSHVYGPSDEYFDVIGMYREE